MSINCESYSFADCDCFFGSPTKNNSLSTLKIKRSTKQDKFLYKFMQDHNLHLNDSKENAIDLQEEKHPKFSIARHKAQKGDKNILPFQRKKKQTTFEQIKFKKFPNNESKGHQPKESMSRLSNRELSYNILKKQVSIAQSSIIPCNNFQNGARIPPQYHSKPIRQRSSKQFFFKQFYGNRSKPQACEQNPEVIQQVVTKQQKVCQTKKSYKILPKQTQSIAQSKISFNNKLQVSSSRKMIEPQHSEATQSFFGDDAVKGSRHIRINSVHTSIGQKTLQSCRSQQLFNMQGFLHNKGRLSTTYTQKPTKTNQSLTFPYSIDEEVNKYQGSTKKLSIKKNSTQFFNKISRINFKPLSKAKQIQSLFDSEQQLSQAFSEVISDKLDGMSTETITFKLPSSLDIEIQSQSLIS